MEREQVEEEKVAEVADTRNIYDIFRRNAETNSSHPVIIFHGKHVSYHAMLSFVDSLAESLRSMMSVLKGDRVGIALPLSPQFIVAFLAVQKIGGIAVPLDSEMTDLEYRNILSVVNLKALFVLDSFRFRPGKKDGIDFVVTTRLQDFLPFESSVAYTAKRIGKAAKIKEEGFKILRFSTLIYGNVGEAAPIDPGTDMSLALISPSRNGELQAMYFTHRNVVASAESISLGFTKQKGRFRIATILPPYLPAAMQLSVVLTIFMGGTVTTVLERNNYYRLFFLCSLFDSDYILMSPYDVGMITRNGLPNLAIRGLKGILCSSYLLNREIRESFEKKYGSRIVEYYGIPEMLGVTHFQSQDRKSEVPGSPGNTIPGVDALILEEKSNEPVAEGTTGELFLKGPGLSSEFNPPLDEPGNYLINGYMDSGDLAQVKDSVFFIMEGRRREAIVSRGILVSSREIEEVIMGIDGVSEVAVVGIPNKWGEEEILAVVSTAKEIPNIESKILRECRLKLSAQKVPGSVELRKELPKTMSGRVLKRQIIEEHSKQQ